MKVEVLFKSHRYEEFDSSTQTCSEPYRGKGLNVLTDWNLYLGSLEENGIILVQHWYDGNPASSQGKVTLEGVEVPASVRKVGCAMLLVSPDELEPTSISRRAPRSTASTSVTTPATCSSTSA